jgi:type I restriction enzyme R subunit
MTEQPVYDVRPHKFPGFLEKIQSRLPALQLLVQMGWTYLTPDEADRLRGDRLDSVILETVLVNHLRHHCRFTFKGADHPFTENAIQSAVQAVKCLPSASTALERQQEYDLLCMGTSVPQTVDGDTKSHIINYIDWKNPAHNTWHCTTGFKVSRADVEKDSGAHIVLFVNGIPLVVMTCELTACLRTRKAPIDRAIDQMTAFQGPDGMPRLFLFSQLLLALAGNTARYGTTGTPRLYWTLWKEAGIDGPLKKVMDTPVADGTMDRLLSGPFTDVRGTYQTLSSRGRGICEQDRLLYALCRPERLLELAGKFILFDAGVKKIARYHQYFTVREVIGRVLSAGAGQPRPGGIVCHASGSGRTLAMMMLAKSLVLHPAFAHPKIILVTNRMDIDDQINSAFRAYGLAPERAVTGKHLASLLADGRTQVVIVPGRKFTAAAAYREMKQADRDTFVLVDAGGGSKTGEHQDRLRIPLKGACFIAFTDTPPSKSDRKRIFAGFGKLFQPAYTINRAVQDKVVVPLLYEARHIPRADDRIALGRWFEFLSSGLPREQQAEVKRCFASETRREKVRNEVRMIAWDVSLHYAAAWQGTGLKGQLAAPDKNTALRYKALFDEFGLVDTEVLISPPTVRGAEDRSDSPVPDEEAFWQEMMDRFGSEKNYIRQLINAFIHGRRPEIIIVAGKLLAGFGAPCNTVLYLAHIPRKNMLCQTVTRVNRLYPGKTYGMIMDYSGAIRDLVHVPHGGRQTAGYDPADGKSALTDVRERIDQLARLRAGLWDLFDAVEDADDPEAYEMHLRKDELRKRFYECFNQYAGTLALALTSTSFWAETPRITIRQYKDDLKFFQRLRVAVNRRYQEALEKAADEPGTRKLLDIHVGTSEAERLYEPLNLLDAGQREKVLADTGVSTGAKADMIAAATRYVIEQEMGRDPAFYQKCSKRLKKAIDAYYTGRLETVETLARISDIAVNVATHTDDDIPEALLGQGMARYYFGCVAESLPAYGGRPEQDYRARIAMLIAKRLGRHKSRDWRINPDALNRMRGEIDDILFDMAGTAGVKLSLEDQDAIIERCIEVAMANED